MTNSTDYSTWLTKQAAADAIGVSVKTIENLGLQGRIASAIRRDPYRTRVYSPDDVQQEATRRREGGSPTYVAGTGTGTPAVVPPSPDNNVARVAPPTVPAQFLELVEGLVADSLARTSTTSTTSSTTKLCLTIPEAAEFAGLSETFIRRACIDGTFANAIERGAFHDGRVWKVRRAALVALYGSPQA